jgi:hypothetical protein
LTASVVNGLGINMSENAVNKIGKPEAIKIMPWFIKMNLIGHILVSIIFLFLFLTNYLPCKFSGISYINSFDCINYQQYFLLISIFWPIGFLVNQVYLLLKKEFISLLPTAVLIMVLIVLSYISYNPSIGNIVIISAAAIVTFSHSYFLLKNFRF